VKLSKYFLEVTDANRRESVVAGRCFVFLLCVAPSDDS